MPFKNMPYLHLYVQDFMTDEKLRECKPESVGVYIYLLCVMHKSEEYGTILLKQNDKQNKNICLNFAYKLSRHLPYSVEVIEKALADLLENDVLQLGKDKLLQKRMLRDNDIRLKRANAGKKGGFATQFAKAKNIANTDNDNDINNVLKEGESMRGEIKSERVKKFELFYKTYPRHEGKKAAEKSFAKIPADEIPKVMDGLQKQINAGMFQKELKFIPHPATWLNQGRWLDEIVTNNGSVPQAPKVTPVPSRPQLSKGQQEFERWYDEQLRLEKLKNAEVA